MKRPRTYALLAVFLPATLAAGLGAILHEIDHHLPNLEMHPPAHHHHHGLEAEHTHSMLVLAFNHATAGPMSEAVQLGSVGVIGSYSHEQELCLEGVLPSVLGAEWTYYWVCRNCIPDISHTPPTRPPVFTLC